MQSVFLIVSLLFYSSHAQQKEWTVLQYADTTSFVGISADGQGNLYFAASTNKILKYTTSGTKVWAVNIGSATLRDITTDSSGNVYVTGFTAVALYGSNSGGDDMFVAKYASDGTQTWIRQLGSSNDDEGDSVAVDSSGNVYVTGGGNGALPSQTYVAYHDLFLVKYSSTGSLVWTRVVGTSGYDLGWAVSIDSSGYIYIAGRAGASVDSQPYSDFADILILKYDPSGSRIWTRMCGTAGVDIAYGISIDSSDNIYVTGYATGSLNSQTASGGNDIILMKYTTAGDRLWTRQFGNSNSNIARDVSADDSGNIYIVGETVGALDSQTAYGSKDIFLTKYTSDGVKKWTRLSGATASGSDDFANGVFADGTGAVFIAGSISGNSMDGVTTTSPTGSNAFIIKYNDFPDPTPTPTASPSTASPSAKPSTSPSANPSASPSAKPSASPTAAPSASPSAKPSSASPTAEPSAKPTNEPGVTDAPSAEPSASPTSPSASPTDAPSAEPSDAPSAEPSDAPSAEPSASPSAEPSDAPSVEPSAKPTNEPGVTDAPSAEPSASPTSKPSASPTDAPSAEPSASPTHEPSASPSAKPSAFPSAFTSSTPTQSPSIGSSVSSIYGNWCIKLGLMDSFGDGWGDGAALRIYNVNDPASHVDITNPDKALVETTVCLNPSLVLNAEVVCSECNFQEPWEMFFFMAERHGWIRESLLGDYNTVVSLRDRDIKVRRNAISDKDKLWTCEGACERRHLGPRDVDRVYDMTGKGWCTKSRSEVKIPYYDASTKAIVRYSYFEIPKGLTAPQFVISNQDRSAVVLRGTLSDSSKHSHYKHGMSISSPIFCNKDVSSLPDGNYVFRIGGALSQDHTHRDTQWDFCGRHGTSDEELQFSVNHGKCQSIAKRSRWSMTQSWTLVDISGSIKLYYDNTAGLDTLADDSFSETILTDIESVIFVEASNFISSLNGVSLTSIGIKDGTIDAQFFIRMDASSYLANHTIPHELILAELQVKFNSDMAIKAIISELHGKSEFASVSKVLISDFHFDGVVPEHSSEGREFTASTESDVSMLDGTLLFYGLSAVVFVSAVLLIFAVRAHR